MANKLLIVGAGGHGKVVADTALMSGNWSEIAFLDDKYPLLNSIHDWPVLGTLNEVEEFSLEYSDCVVAIGSSSLRMELIKKYLKRGYSLPAIIHPASSVSSFVSLGAGCVVFAKTVINSDSKIGDGCILNTGVIVDHDCELGEGVHLAPGVNLAGGVCIGHRSLMGVGSSVIPQIVIGQNVIAAAGSVVTQDIGDNCTVAGVPAKVIKNHE